MVNPFPSRSLRSVLGVVFSSGRWSLLCSYLTSSLKLCKFEQTQFSENWANCFCRLRLFDLQFTQSAILTKEFEFSQEKHVLLITLDMALLCVSVPGSHGSVTVKQRKQQQDHPEAEAAAWNSFFGHTCMWWISNRILKMKKGIERFKSNKKNAFLQDWN